jgi:hypothetical protein
MRRVALALAELQIALGHAFRSQLSLYMDYLSELDDRMQHAKLLPQREHVSFDDNDFIFSQDWGRCEPKIEFLMIETGLRVSHDAKHLQAFLRIEDTRNNGFCLSVIPGDTPSERRYWMEADIKDSDMPLSLLMNKLGILPGECAIIEERILAFFSFLFDRI